MTAQQILTEISERQISDDTRLRRVVALFQRELGDIFGNASVKRRNRRYEIDVAVYERPGRMIKMPDRMITEWIRKAAEKSHPRLYKRMTVNIQPWTTGRVSHKLFAPVKILIDATPTQQPSGQADEV